jgi:hypothetical protein
MKFIIIHIPKTAGTSLRENIIKPLFGDAVLYDKSVKLPLKEQLIRINDSEIGYNWDSENLPPNYDNYDVIMGHFPIQKYEHLGWPTITFLRDPVERVLSHYYFWYINDGFTSDFTIFKFAKAYANIMTKQIGSDLSKLDFIGLTEYFDESLYRFAKQFDLVLPKDRTKYRVGANRMQLTEGARESIEALNKQDYELYNEVLKEYRRK